MDLFEAAAAREARDAGMKAVLDHSGAWKDRARLKIRELAPGWTGTGEDIRLLLQDRPGLRPQHHNAWGAVIGGCLRQGWLQATGELRHMRCRESHARKTAVYVRTELP